MPLYVYKALTPTGNEFTREMTSPSEAELRRELERQGLLVKAVWQKRTSVLSFLGQRVKPEDFLQSNQELITLLKAGLTVPEALELAADRPGSPVLTSVLKRILQDVRGGMLFSAACAKYPKVFDGLYLSSLKTGERMGNLASPLGRYQDYLRQRVTLQGKVSQALVYPIFLVIVLALVMGLLFTFVMPRFAALYADFNATLPFPTRVLMILVRHLTLLGLVAGGGGLLAWVSFSFWAATDKGRLWLDNAKQRLPIFSTFTRPFLVSQFSRTLSTLLSGGTPLAEALQATEEALSNRAYALKLRKASGRVLEGEGLSKAAGEEGLLPRSAVKLLEVGEASGQLESMLEEIALSHERLLEGRIQRVMALVEPLFILLTGLLIGTIIIVMYLPIIHLSDIVK